jgi:hypothetical protein
LRALETNVLSRISGSRREKMIGSWSKQQNEEYFRAFGTDEGKY